METLLLKTKFNIPPSKSGLVPRPHLIDRLDSGLEGKLTLVSAPAGYGKTTLVSSWVNSIQTPSAWFAVDEGDNDLSIFLASLSGCNPIKVPGYRRGYEHWPAGYPTTHNSTPADNLDQ